MRTKMTVGRMAVKTTNPGKPVKKTAEPNPSKPVKKTAEQAQAEALSRYNAKKASQKALSSSLEKLQSEAAARAKAKAGGYKTNAKGELILSGGKKATYKGGVTPEKMKNANVQITKTLPEVTVKATKRAAVSNLASYNKKAKK